MNTIAQETGYPFPFNPSWLDDYGFSSNEYRVYLHICRRAGKSGKCWASIPSIASVCKLDVKTVRKVIASLKQYGAIAVEEVPGRTNLITLIDPNEWVRKPKKTPTKLGTPTKSGSTKNGTPPLPNLVDEGIPCKAFLNIDNQHQTLDITHRGAVARSEFKNDEEFDQEPVDKNDSSLRSVKGRSSNGGERKTLGADQSAPRTPEIFSTRSRRQPRQIKISNKLNDLDWLQMDKKPRFKLARGVTVKRMQILMCRLFSNVKFMVDYDGYLARADISGWGESDTSFEGESLFEDSSFKFDALRDELYEMGLITKEGFNAALEAIFEESVSWIQEHGSQAKQILSNETEFRLFGRSDLRYMNTLKGR